ncbi:MAG: prepilin-type N-terminal cleavage/methylation domain-containing protein, partial [Burkholderiales bacterium]
MFKKTLSHQSGFTLAELMVGMTIGLIVLSGVSSAYLASSRSGRDSQASSEQVENGRQAIQYVMNDLRHAGYFGQWGIQPAPGAALPDPCETADLTA